MSRKTDGEYLDEVFAIIEQDGEIATDSECLDQIHSLLVKRMNEQNRIS